MKLQEVFYKDNKMNETEYKTQFGAMNERLAEIEEEKLTLDMQNRNKQKSFVKEKPIEIKMEDKVIENRAVENKIAKRDEKKIEKQSLFGKIKDLFKNNERFRSC